MDALGLQGEVDSQHIELRVDFNVARVSDIELEEGLVPKLI